MLPGKQQRLKKMAVDGSSLAGEIKNNKIKIVDVIFHPTLSKEPLL